MSKYIYVYACVCISGNLQKQRGLKVRKKAGL